MGSVPHNKWVFEKASGGNNFYNIREVNSGKYLFAVTDGGTGIMLKVRDIKEGSLSGKWELEHVSGQYYRIKNIRYSKYLQNPRRHLAIEYLPRKGDVKFANWRIRKEGVLKQERQAQATVRRQLTPKTKVQTPMQRQPVRQVGFNPSLNHIYSINSPFTAYDITNKKGVARMGSVPYNKWVFEKVDSKHFNIREVKTGKYLHVENAGKIEVGNIKQGWWSAMWELEHVSGLYYRIKNKYRKTYLQNPNRSLSIGNLSNKNAKYGTWRIRRDGVLRGN